jgi:SEC-C motif
MSDLPTHPLLYEIATAEEVPCAAIAQCMLCIPDVAPELLAAIARGAEAPVASQSELNLVYYGAHILGAAREPRLQAPLLRLLRLPDDTLDELLGEEYVTIVPQIAIGAFDGDAEALYDLVCDAEAPEFVRMPMFGAIAYLTWLGRIPPATTRGFLYRFDADRVIPAGDIGWNGWETAIELLGWQEFVPLVEAAYADDRLETGMSDLQHFKKGLAAAAAAAPDDDRRFKVQDFGYIEDVLETIVFPALLLGARDDALADDLDYDLDELLIDEPDEAEEMPQWTQGEAPRRNPMRHVGRNDPCPCGSGKKYKRCCLAA